MIFLLSIAVHALAGTLAGAVYGNPVLGLMAGLSACTADIITFLIVEAYTDVEPE